MAWRNYCRAAVAAGDFGRSDLRRHAAGAESGRHIGTGRGGFNRIGYLFDHVETARLRMAARIGVVYAINVGENNKRVGFKDLCGVRGEAIIVAIADFARRHRIIFIDDRQRAEIEQRSKRSARIEISSTVFGVAKRKEQLRDIHIVSSEGVLPSLRQRRLTGCGRSLFLIKTQSFFKAQPLASKSDGARCDDDDFNAALTQARDIVGHRSEPIGAHPILSAQNSGPDLDDEPFGAAKRLPRSR